MSGPDEVARYYDRNTRRFLAFGRGRSSRAIHRELWGPGVSSPDEALAYADELVRAVITERIAGCDPRVVDLGCGVGGTVLHLAERLPGARLRGITLSEAQHELAERLVRERGFEGRCRIELGDFQRNLGSGDADVAIAIESYGHTASVNAFVRAAASHLRSGGLLVVVDDFVAPGSESDARVDTIRRGWRLPGLCTVEDLLEAGAGVGFTALEDADLTTLVALSRPRDRALALVAPALERLGLVTTPLFANMIGGNALREGLREGTMEYRMLVLERGTGRDIDGPGPRSPDPDRA